MSGLRERGVAFTSLHEALDTTTPGGRLVFHVFAALAEFIRELIVQGPTRVWTPPAPEVPVSAARRRCPTNRYVTPATCLHGRRTPSPRSRSSSGVSRNTIYNYVPELKGGRLALAEATNTAELPRPSRSED